MKKYYFTTEQLTVGYDGVPLISEIEIKLEKGEILTLIGPNGAGKSTILKSITKQLSVLYGTIYLDQCAVNKMTEKELSTKMAVVLTERIRPEMMTCEDVVATGRYPYTGKLGILTEHDRQIIKKAMDLVHIQDLKEKDFVRVSDGQKQRVMLARAICQEPEILVLDEPTSYLDIKYKLEFLAVLQEMARKEKLTVIMSLHELDLAQRVSDQLLCVREAQIERFGPPEKIFVPGYIASLYNLKEGSFDENAGRPELPAAKGSPLIFVIAGGGSGISVYRRLQRKGIPFSTGILGENDMDCPVAKALAVKVITETAFERVKEETYDRAREEMDRCKTVICCLTEFGEMNQVNRKLMEAAALQSKLCNEESVLPVQWSIFDK